MSKREEEQKQQQREHLEKLAGEARDMRTVVLDGDKGVAYFVGKRELDIGDQVIAVPFPKLIILLGSLCKDVIAPLWAGRVVTHRVGGEEPNPHGITS
jgi:hypothetical protein